MEQSGHERKSEKIEYRGLTFNEALQLIFITLKLCGVIEWSWVWVLAPAWILVAFKIIEIIVKVVRGREKSHGGV